MPPKKEKVIVKPIVKDDIEVNSDDVDDIKQDKLLKKDVPIIPKPSSVLKPIVLKKKVSIAEPRIEEKKPESKKEESIIKSDSKIEEPIVEILDEDEEEEEVEEEVEKEKEEKEEKEKEKEEEKEEKEEKEEDKKIIKNKIIEKEMHNHSKPKKMSASQKIESSFDMFGNDDVDFRFVMMNYDYTKNKTLPKITKYERALLIGKRAKQIEEGANANIKIMPGQSAIEIAEEELRQRKIPLIIKRPIGNTFEYWKPADMEVLMD